MSSRLLVGGGRGFCAGAPHGLLLGCRCQVICILLMLSDSSHCAFIVTVNKMMVAFHWCFQSTCICEEDLGKA